MKVDIHGVPGVTKKNASEPETSYDEFGRPYRIIRDAKGYFLPGSGGPGRKKGSRSPAHRWRNQMFNAWLDSGLSLPEVQLAWLRGESVALPNGTVLDFKDSRFSVADRWIQLQKLFTAMAPKELALSGDVDPDAQAAAIARDRSIADVMESLQDELDRRAKVIEGQTE